MALLLSTSLLKGTVVVCVATSDGSSLILACDSKSHHTDKNQITTGEKLVELEPGFVVGCAGIWRTDDGTLNVYRDIRAAYKQSKSGKDFLRLYDEQIRPKLAEFLSRRWREAPEMFRKEYLVKPTHAQALLVCRVNSSEKTAVMFEYFPRIVDSSTVEIVIKETKRETSDNGYWLGIGDGASYININDPAFQAVARLSAVDVAKMMVQQAIKASPETCGEPITLKILLRTQ